MAFGDVPPGLGHGHRVQRPLFGRSEIQADLLDGGRNDEQVRGDFLGEHGGGEVFVNHGRNPAQDAFGVGHDGNAATAGSNDNAAVFDQVPDDGRFDYAHGDG